MAIEHADCGNCSLGKFLREKKAFSPIAAEKHAKDGVVILGDAPTAHDATESRPFVGPAGFELQAALDSLGVKRDECQLNTVVLCSPPQNKLTNFVSRVSRINTKRRQRGKDPLPIPQAACRGRLLKDMEGFTKIIAMGKEAASAVRGGNPSIMGLRGACEEVEMPWGMAKVAYTVHPSFVLRNPKWREVFLNDMDRAFRYFEDNLTWKDPEIIIVESAQELMACFDRLVEMGKPVAYDVETGMESPLASRLRCIGIGNEDLSILVPLKRINPQEPDYFSGQEDMRVRTLVRTFLQTAPVPIVGHNAGQFDRLVCERAFQITPKLSADTLLLHLLVDNEMPHNLGFITSFYTDFVEAWKANHTATTTQDDNELHVYCAKDVAATAKIARPLAQEVKARKQWHLLAREHELQNIGCGMQRLGMRVDIEKLADYEAKFEVLLGENTAKCQSIVDVGFNPLSTKQLSDLLFREWKLTPEKYNEKTGMPSTDDDTLRRMITHHDLDEEKVEFLRAARLVRRYRKLLGTYIRPLREKLILSDGRIHPAYNRLPATGRYSSSRPNAQNIPAFLRDLFIPEEGHLFVGADMDQLELRLIAEEAKSTSLLRIINEGLDPHNENMEAVYGKSIWSLDGAPEDRRKKGKGTFKRTRGITKNVFYAWQYAASVPTIHQQVVSVEDDDGKLIYAHLTHRDIRDVVKGLKKANPEIPKWWEKTRQAYRRQGFLVDSLWGRRRDFKNEEKLNELVNHPIQAGGAAIVHEAMLQLVTGHLGWGTVSCSAPTESDLFSFNFEERLGLVNQCHDSLLFEVREDDAEEAAKILQETMTRERKKNPLLKYTAESEIGNNWLET